MAKKSAKSVADEGILLIAENRKARHDYEFIDKFEAGVVLMGAEVKSVRSGGMNLKDSYVKELNGELFLIGCHISPYKFARVEKYDPTQDRKLLMHRKEIERLAMQSVKKGLTLVAVKAYFRRGRCKIEIALAKGKKAFDRRDDVKSREAKREIDRALRRNES